MDRENATYCVLLSQEEREAVTFELEVFLSSIKEGREVEWLHKGDERPVEKMTAAEPSPAYNVADSEKDEYDEDEAEYEEFMALMITSIEAKLVEIKRILRFGLLFLDWYEADWLINHLQIALDVYAGEKAASKESKVYVFPKEGMLADVPVEVYLESNVASARRKLVEAFAERS
jgi:hypothetical protein